ncbi:MAG: 50S ribosomal protein L2 [Candidatus Baldrarchaeia archaeon]
MGKRILVQRKGRGGPTFRAPSHKRIAPVKYPPLDPNVTIKGKVVDLVHEPGRCMPVAFIKLENGQECVLLPHEGCYIGEEIVIGANAPIKMGNILPLKAIPEGTPIFNIESEPGDGGKFVRASGTYAVITTKTATSVYVQLPSGKVREFHPNCRATIGVVAGGGRTEKPFVKAGKVYHLSKAKSWKWPVVRGVAMNPVAHPHGGGSHQSPRKPTTVSRNAPPGRKVGHIAARRTGRKKK